MHNISGFPVVERDTGRLVGILTNRDVRFATDPNTRVYELMTRDPLITVPTPTWTARRPASCCTSTASRSCWWSTTATAASA